MPGLEATLRISAKDNTGAAVAELKQRLEGLDKQISVMDKLMTAAAKVTKTTDPMAASITNAQRALSAQREAILGAAESLDRLAGPSDAAASAQGRLRAEVQAATRAMVVQGTEALRVAETIQAAQRRAARGAGGGAHGGGGVRAAITDNLPFLGPTILGKTKEAVAAGATVQDEIARLAAAGAKPDEIARARDDFRAFSRTHSGVSEAEYLATFRDARVISPGEAYEMSNLGARYRSALRASGLPTSESDIGNVMRIMDELGLKSMPEREDFIGNFLKTQQVFGSQISTETALAAYRNAKQSIYDWSPEFRNDYFPTLLQSSGQAGGTEMMTALNNYIGHHMQKTEIESLIAAGFVRPEDVKTDHGRTTFRDNAKLFEADVFKQNIAHWAWDFHDEYIKRAGATEGGFGDLIAKMPRNMAGLIAFLVHNRQRIERDVGTRRGAIGFAAGEDTFLGQNPTAGLDALGKAIQQFSAAVTAPSMDVIGRNLQATAHGLQLLAASYGDFADKHPGAAAALGIGAMGAGAGTGGWLSFKLMTGLGRLLGFGGAAEGGAGAAAAGGGWLGAIGGALAGAAEVVGPLILMRAIGEAANPTTPAGARYRVDQAWPSQVQDMEKAWRAEQEWRRDPEAAHARALGALSGGGSTVGVTVTGSADVNATIRVEAGSELLRVVDTVKNLVANMPLQGGGLTGRMDGDAAPRRTGGIGHM